MDEKDPKDEELNPQGQDDVNDADDSFGLPDLDYKPLEEDTSETEEASSEEEAEPETEEAESTYASESSADDQHEPEGELAQEIEEEKPTLRYQMEEESSNAPKIIGGIIVVLVIAALVWYFGFYQKQQKEIAAAEKAKQEQLDKQKAAEEEAARKMKAKADAAAAAEEAQLAAETQEQANAGVQILSERSGRYYIVLESFVDEDFAKDFGNKVAQEGTPSFLIPPYSKKKMQRVAIGGYDSMDEAKAALNDLAEEFGTGKWILKY